MSKVKIDIIGSGRIVNWMLSDLKYLNNKENIEIVGIYSIDIEQASELAKKYSIKKVYKNINELLSSNSNAVYNGTPDSFHFELNKLVLENNKNLYCEKPLVLTSFENKQLIEIAERNKKLIFHGIKTPFSPIFQYLIKNLDKFIGNIKYIDAGFCKLPSNKALWNPAKEIYAPSVEYDLGVYPVFVVNYLLNMPKIVYSSIKKYENIKGLKEAQIVYKNNSSLANVITSKNFTNKINLTISGDKGFAVVGGDLIQFTQKYKTDSFHMAKSIEFYDNNNKLVKRKVIDFESEGEGLRFPLEAFVDDILNNRTENSILTNELNLKIISDLYDLTN